MKNVILTHSASLFHFPKCKGHGKELKHVFKKCFKRCFQEVFESILSSTFCYA